VISFGYFGDGPWSHRALQTLLADDRFRLAFVVARSSRDEPTLRTFAEAAGVPFLRPDNVNGDAFLEAVAPLAADLFVSMSYDQIFRGRLIRLPRLGVVNCHAGALPRYRGRNVLNWAIINGEDHFGVSVHYIDEGIDTGDLIAQRRVGIAPEDTYLEVLEKAFPACAETLHAALVDIAEDRVTRTPQSGTGFYCGMRRDGDEWLEWTWPSKRVHDFIRGVAPPAPGARTALQPSIVQPSALQSSAGDVQVALLRSRLVPGAPSYYGTPGEVIGVNARGVVVKTGDAYLEVHEVAQVAGDGSLGEVKRPRYRVGSRFHPSVTEYRLAKMQRELDVLRSHPEPVEAR